MAKKGDAAPGGAPPSKGLLDAISANHFGCFVDLPRLGDADAATLLRMLEGKEPSPVPIDRKRAIAALARSSGSPESVAFLSGVVASAREPRSVRAAAARLLSEAPPARAEAALLSNLAIDDETIRTEIVAALGVVGGEEALKRLESLQQTGDDAFRKQLEFARVMIGLRVAPARVNAARSLGVIWEMPKVERLDSARLQVRLRALHENSYRIPLSTDVGFEFDCGDGTHVVLVNAAFERGAFLKQLRRGNSIAALVALAEPAVAHLSIRYVVLTAPIANGLSIIVAKGSGEAVLSGEAIAEGETLRLQLRDVGQARVPIEIGGTVSDDAIALEVRVWRGALRPKRRPVAIPSR